MILFLKDNFFELRFSSLSRPKAEDVRNMKSSPANIKNTKKKGSKKKISKLEISGKFVILILLLPETILNTEYC